MNPLPQQQLRKYEMEPVYRISESSPKLSALEELRIKLLQHPLYGSVRTIDNLRLFMREHVFAVWDFMSLLKRLQQIVTCCEVPWLPASDASLARFVNEIVLGEECDADGHGGYASHFELYLAAMEEVGADTSPIQIFIKQIRRRVPIEQALDAVEILPSTREFVRSTIRLTMSGQPHEVAAAFFYGREDVIPEMFSRFVDSLPKQGVSVERLEHYLRRHIELDANDHGPLAQRLLSMLCDNLKQRESEAINTALQAVTQRIALWEGICNEIQK
jgi:hypothetical protein